ncbi:pre-mRNA-splicing factor CWC22 homolog [Amborella trichopoda]|uniref:pre-mRNA-splicing factor CWC22 homolog n=1 Tax=Amborella trichopoda TaxID=13333 RepID=UPI0005D3F51E|nr:pre-mRNA-splicing factor CWC22 homolog [Amborella trichopoda]|eukprot:XP_020521154.1 pre-mRNA-splicing factor CWC22 homolog [Amborella trichopoda]
MGGIRDERLERHDKEERELGRDKGDRSREAREKKIQHVRNRGSDSDGEHASLRRSAKDESHRHESRRKATRRHHHGESDEDRNIRKLESEASDRKIEREMGEIRERDSKRKHDDRHHDRIQSHEEEDDDERSRERKRDNGHHDRRRSYEEEDDDERSRERNSRQKMRNEDSRKREHYDRGHHSKGGAVKEEAQRERHNRIRKGDLEDGKKLENLQINRKTTTTETNTGRSGGVYIPPFKLAQMMKEVQDKSSIEYQRLTWDALRKSINGLVNKVNASNIKNIIPELFSENLLRGRGLFCRSCMKSQMASPGFTDVFAALVAVVNTKFPEVGNLLLRRIVLQLKRSYKRNDKPLLLATTKFIAHLVNQQVAHEIIALELLTVLLENPTDDSVEVAVCFVKECGSLLQDLSSQGLHGIFERFRGILHEGEIDKRVQFLIEGLFAIRKAKFQGYPAVRQELDLVEQEDQFTHELSLDEEIDQEIGLDIFKPDLQYLEHEKAYEELKKDILGDESSDEEGSDKGSDDEDEEETDEEEEEKLQIKDETETNLVNLRRTIYLTIMSSVDFEEAGHKLLKIKLEPGQEMCRQFTVEVRHEAMFEILWPFSRYSANHESGIQVVTVCWVSCAPMFHVSCLKKKLSKLVVLQVDRPEIDEEGTFKHEPIAILDNKLVNKRNQAMTKVSMH